MADAQPLELVADNLGRQSVDVDGDIGQLRHRDNVPAVRRAGAVPAGGSEARQPTRWIAARIAADGACQPTMPPWAAIIASVAALNSGK